MRITTLRYPSIVLLCTELRLASTRTMINQARVPMGINIETNNSTYADESDRTDLKNFPTVAWLENAVRTRPYDEFDETDSTASAGHTAATNSALYETQRAER